MKSLRKLNHKHKSINKISNEYPNAKEVEQLFTARCENLNNELSKYIVMYE